MKKNILALLFLFLFSLVKAQPANHKTDLAKENLKGKVKTVTEFEYRQDKPGEGVPKNDLLTYQQPERKIFDLYNADGNKIVRRLYWPYPELGVKDSFIYNANGLLLKQITLFTRLKKGPNNFIYKYNEKGVLTERDYMTDNDSIAARTVFEYNESGNKKGQKEYSGGKLTSESICDKNDNTMEWKGYDHALRVNDKKKMKHDERGNLTETCTYDDKDQLLEKQTYRYDENGNELEENSEKTNKENTKDTYTYAYIEYDKTGNWIKRTSIDIVSYEDRPLMYTQVRTIEYY